MLIKVQFQKQFTDIVVEDCTEAGTDGVNVDDLSTAIQKHLDVSTNNQKLIFKGKVLQRGDPLSKYGIKDGSKVMLMASGTLTQVLVDLSVARA